ncbi:sirohydrochlorin cobaltochelatase [Zongyangia hominis]|uniref:Sirohydrochlorin cobaltochelatase n=1 Tax=Zongyangia hominis TaxID=2763677 RepID=A0A926I5V8_9FIRM|nr:sirohydrochlorin cobaltochelatase [Zongyangia hominis]MBC8569309.1 sirohydrochlorin cobaltochelatase [Zongyangia hominis]
MKKITALILSVLLCAGVFTGCGEKGLSETPDSFSSISSGESQKESETPVKKGDPGKKAILVVSFGTSYNDTREATIGAIEKEIADAFPDYEVRRAFTSQTIIDKLKDRDGLEIDNVTQAVERLIADGFGTVICQPTHVMHGLEYDDMMAEVGAYADSFEMLRFGEPLLSSAEDYKEMAEALVANIPSSGGDEAVVVMGHGTEHFANATYAALDYTLKDLGHSRYFVGTVEAYPRLDSVVKGVEAMGAKKVILAPLMIVAGDHATKDMASDEEGSWKMEFKKRGYEVDIVMKGLGEYPQVRALYVSHVRAAIDGEEK